MNTIAPMGDALAKAIDCATGDLADCRHQARDGGIVQRRDARLDVCRTSRHPQPRSLVAREHHHAQGLTYTSLPARTRRAGVVGHPVAA